jgi:hypothetical protein
LIFFSQIAFVKMYATRTAQETAADAVQVCASVQLELARTYLIPRYSVVAASLAVALAVILSISIEPCRE